ncbi:adenosine deaminase domain-containing protein 1 [Corythoichthys intestinalis]|uniref:adenosine deaminase domain-containing protein 1 n=1 Tax=Corythoichthys intestinalis TaxID=161448 RepID=UPI0025A640EE|nr:adenosine deaminase domain-containing protein 1 [Corythoichthys intestinalis]XP_061793293.1 adenosine deaminase domain-containing protein 1 [Nerophis lumbriciformis]
MANREKPNGQHNKNSKYKNFLKDPVGIEVLIKRYRSGESHPVTLLHQMAQTMQFHLEIKETVTTADVSGFFFAFCVVIDGIQYKTGMGITKKEARFKAAELALADLLPVFEKEKHSPVKVLAMPPFLVVKEESSHSEIQANKPPERESFANFQIPNAVKDQLIKLMNSHPQFSACTASIAAFVIQTSTGCEVVAVGTGNYSTKESISTSGRMVHDSHAVVTARRSLMRFLYQHLLMFFSKMANLVEKSIFQRSNNDLLSLKSGIQLHLYLNQVPKGAIQMPSKLSLRPQTISSWEMSIEMGLHVSVEGKVFPVIAIAPECLHTKVVSLSSMDKIAQWQVLGYQGALLSHFIEPIYVQNIFVGDEDIRGIEMILRQRTEGITNQLPMLYCMVRPHISAVPAVASISADNVGQVTYGFNWSIGDSSIEVVDGLLGKTIDESPFKSGPALSSRLCKAAMLRRYKFVAEGAQRQDLLATPSYREAKRMAKQYQEAKNALRTSLMQQGFGCWPKKLMVSDDFNM